VHVMYDIKKVLEPYSLMDNKLYISVALSPDTRFACMFTGKYSYVREQGLINNFLMPGKTTGNQSARMQSLLFYYFK
jgi:hypothetical protein